MNFVLEILGRHRMHRVTVERRHPAAEETASGQAEESPSSLGAMSGPASSDPAIFATALRESEERFRQLADAMPQLVWTAAPDGRVDYYNARWREYRGISPGADESGPAWNWAPTLHPDDEALTIEAWRRALQTGEPYQVEHRVRMADGGIRWHLSRGIPRRDAAGRIVKWYGTATDIHDFRVAQEAARISEERFRLVARATNDVIWDWDLRTGRIEWNETTLKNFGCPAPQLGSTIEVWQERVHPEDRERVNASIHAAIDGRSETWSAEYRFRREDGSYATFLDRGHIARDGAGRAHRMIGSMMDLTEHRRVEAELRKAKEEAEQANKAKDQFLAALSHELRTPLTPVLVVTQMLEADEAIPPAQRDDLRMIRRNVELEMRLIDDLLDLTRIARGKLQMQMEATDVHRVLEDAARIGCDQAFCEKGLDLRYDLRATNFSVYGDAARLGQVFWNLIKNAVKFTPAGGRITLRSRNPAPDRLEVTIEDTGRGIDPEVLPHIFDAFEQGGEHITRKFGGLGLGLAIARAVAELHRGRISARSAGAGRGAEFVLELPTHTPADRPGTDLAGTVKESEARPAGPRRQRILLVEDHAHSANAIARLLVREGHVVRIASTVAEGLAAASAERFDVLVSDLGLPDGSGNDLMRELRQRYGLRGIALSGFGMEEDVARSRAAGFEAHLVKPVRIQQVLESVQSLAAKGA